MKPSPSLPCLFTFLLLLLASGPIHGAQSPPERGDKLGTEAYNINLSQRRAESVRNYLHKKFGISRENMLMYWYGYANPVASNKTAEGRQQNRRVTIVLRDKK